MASAVTPSLAKIVQAQPAQSSVDSSVPLKIGQVISGQINVDAALAKVQLVTQQGALLLQNQPNLPQGLQLGGTLIDLGRGQIGLKLDTASAQFLSASGQTSSKTAHILPLLNQLQAVSVSSDTLLQSRSVSQKSALPSLSVSLNALEQAPSVKAQALTPLSLAQNALKAVAQQKSYSSLTSFVDQLNQLPLMPQNGASSLSQERLVQLDKILRSLDNFQLDGDQPLDGDILKKAIENSGLFYEARLVQNKSDALSPKSDFKNTLLLLKNILGGTVHSAHKITEPRLSLPFSSPSSLPEPPTAHSALKTQQPLTKQPVSVQQLSSLALGQDDVLGALSEKIEGVLSRLKLLQMASLKGEGRALSDSFQNISREQALSFIMEIPISMQTQHSVLGLKIESDESHSSDQEGARRQWHIQLALDIEPLGPVQGDVKLKDQTLRVILWVDRTQTYQHFENAVESLHVRLRDQGFEVDEIYLKKGQPPHRKIEKGQWMDTSL